MVRFISADMGILKILRKKVCFISLSKTTEIMGFCVDSVYLPHMGFRFFYHHHLEIDDMVKNPLDMIMIIMYIFIKLFAFLSFSWLMTSCRFDRFSPYIDFEWSLLLQQLNLISLFLDRLALYKFNMYSLLVHRFHNGKSGIYVISVIFIEVQGWF